MLEHHPNKEHAVETPARVVAIIENLKKQESIVNSPNLRIIDKVGHCPLEILYLTHSAEYVTYIKDIKDLWRQDKIKKNGFNNII